MSTPERATILAELDAARAAQDWGQVAALEVRLGWDMIDSGDFAEALPYVDDAVRLLTDDATRRIFCCALLNAGRVHMEIGDVDGAISHYTAAWRLEDLIVHGHSRGDIANQFGLLHERAGREDEAMAWFQRGVQPVPAPPHQPDDVVPALNLARMAHERDDHETAADLLMSIPVELIPDTSGSDVGWMLTMAGYAARSRSQYTVALERYGHALILYGDAERGLRRVLTESFSGAAASLNGDTADAISHFRAALALVDAGTVPPPKHRTALLHDIAERLIDQDDLEEAVGLLD